MNAPAGREALPWVSLGLLAVLLACAPWAMRFAPEPAGLASGAEGGPEVARELHHWRAAWVLLGLGFTLLAGGEFVLALRRHRADVLALSPSIAAFFACAVVGWRSYPYWIMGVYQVELGRFPWRDQDPKNLLPMTWIGDFWRMPALGLYPVCFCLVPVLLVLAWLALGQRRYATAGVTVAGIAVAMMFMLGFSPRYVDWLMD